MSNRSHAGYAVQVIWPESPVHGHYLSWDAAQYSRELDAPSSWTANIQEAQLYAISPLRISNRLAYFLAHPRQYRLVAVRLEVLEIMTEKSRTTRAAPRFVEVVQTDDSAKEASNA